jgi:2'-5' RNA ligase
MARVRSFLAVEVTDAVRRKAAALQGELARTGADINWVDPANLHVTLLFLGEVEDRELHSLCRLAAAAVAAEPPFEVRVGGVGAFPNGRRPKTVWAGVTAGAAELGRLYAGLEQALVEAGFYRREERAYTPHLTLGRVKSEAAGQLLAPALPKHLAWDGGRAAVGEVVAFASELRREGPVYVPLGRAPLLGPEEAES